MTALRLSRGAAFAALALHAVTCVLVIGSRVGFPGQIEWMTGSILDHVERVRAGQPVYTAPGASFIAYIYPPLYYWVGAAVGGGAIACRLVSVASAIVEAALAGRIAFELGASKRWSVAAAGLFFASYSYCGWWYDVERSDTLFGAMALGVCLLVMRARTIAIYAVAGALGGLAFFAKQQAVFYVAGAALGIVLARRPRSLARAAIFSAAAGIVLLVIGGWCHRSSGGWFEYYVLKMPGAHGIMAALVPDVVSHDVLGLVLVVATLIALAHTVKIVRERGDDKTILFGSMLFAGFGAAVSSRLHIGGWINVLQPWTTFASIALAVLASRLEPRPSMAVAVNVAIVIQCVLFGYDPRMFVPRAGMAEATARFHAHVRELETKGDVLLVSQGHITKERHFQMSALADVVRVEGRSPPDLVHAIRDRRFAAVIDDARIPGDHPPVLWPPVMLEDVADLRDPLFASYFVGERLDDATIALPMAAPAMPRWVLFPRAHPLDGLPSEELEKRHHAEMRLADDRSRAIAEGKPAPFATEAIEMLAENGGPATP